ncbi:MAG: putative lipopolysaccharide heptosyltransferase III [Candidatus Schekmanbacteria bacterium]|nr:putative lipopolysaccharide heptosyltransferase III [Candidatus Schekmanbacteria bacterium]
MQAIKFLRKLIKSGQFVIWKLIGIFQPSSRGIDQADENPPRILVIQLNAIGDLLMTTPAINSLRQKFPQARLDVLVRPHTKEILGNNPHINHIYTLERQPLQQGCLNLTYLADTVKTIRRLSRQRYSQILDFSGLFQTAWIGFMIGAQYRLGFKKKVKLGWSEIYGFDYLYTLEVTSQKNHLIEQNLELLKPLGCNPAGQEMEAFPAQADFDYIDKTLKMEGVSANDSVVCIHPGAKWPPKRWPEKNYAELVCRLMQQEAKVCLLGAKDEETPQSLMRRCGFKPINLAGRLNLLQTAALIKTSRLFIGNDSGPMHIAAAMHTPSLLFFGPVSPETSAPRNADAFIFYKNPGCSPCTLYFTKDRCEKGQNICLEIIGVDEVWNKVLQILK